MNEHIDTTHWHDAAYMDTALERCRQERFFMPTPIVQGAFYQLVCGCIWQAEDGFGRSITRVTGDGLYCAHCDKWTTGAYVGFWRTLYSEYVPLCTGPLTEESDHYLRNKLYINCPITPYF